MRLRFRMTDRDVVHSISSLTDSMIVAQVLETRLMRKHKYFICFENFKGELHYFPSHPERSRLTLDIDATSVACRDKTLRGSKQRRVSEYVRESVLNASVHPGIQFASYQISTKALRGMTVEGVLTVRGTTRVIKMNAVFTPLKTDRLEIEADSLFRFSDFGVKPPSSLFGMVETSDQVLIHLHLYAVGPNAEISQGEPTPGIPPSSNAPAR